jgi:hypothetical protein
LCQERYDEADMTLPDVYLPIARHSSANEVISPKS